MFFATSILHVHLMQWENESSVQDAVNRCNAIWKSIESEKVSPVPLLLSLCMYCGVLLQRIGTFVPFFTTIASLVNIFESTY